MNQTENISPIVIHNQYKLSLWKIKIVQTYTWRKLSQIMILSLIELNRCLLKLSIQIKDIPSLINKLECKQRNHDYENCKQKLPDIKYCHINKCKKWMTTQFTQSNCEHKGHRWRVVEYKVLSGKTERGRTPQALKKIWHYVCAVSYTHLTLPTNREV